MPSKITRIQVRRDTTDNWQLSNTLLSDGELGLEFREGDVEESLRLKVGDGTTRWNDLKYLAASEYVAGAVCKTHL